MSIVIATRGRHRMLEQSVPATLDQEHAPLEVLIVDTSPTAWTNVPSDPRVRYHWLPDAVANRNWQRNYGIARTTGEVVVVPDDDIRPSRAWLRQLVSPYADPAVGSVGGRVIEGPDIPVLDPTRVSTLTWWGQVGGDFRAITPGPVEVPHLKGCNISFRRDVLVRVGGYDERIDGWAMRDETDLCVRVAAAGYKLVYNPAAVVEHFGYSLWTSRDLRIEPAWTSYSGAKTTTYFVLRNFGLWAGLVWIAYSAYRSVGRAAKAIVRTLPTPLFAATGFVAGAAQAALPRRHEGLRASDAFPPATAGAPDRVSPAP